MQDRTYAARCLFLEVWGDISKEVISPMSEKCNKCKFEESNINGYY